MKQKSISVEALMDSYDKIDLEDLMSDDDMDKVIMQSLVKHRRELCIAISAAILAFYCFLIYTIIIQQQQIIELQKDKKQFNQTA